MPARRTPLPGRVPSVGGPLSRDVPFRYAGHRPPPASGRRCGMLRSGRGSGNGIIDPDDTPARGG